MNNEMKEGIFLVLKIIGGVAFLGLILGFIGGLSGSTKDCKGDPNCFAEALQTCAKASISISNFWGNSVTYKIIGSEGENCKLFKVGEIPIANKVIEEECLAKKGQTLTKDDTTSISFLNVTDCGNKVVKQN